MIGDIPGCGTVWFGDSAITNVLSLYIYTRRFYIQFDNWNENHFILSTPNHAFVFQKSQLGLYCHDIEHLSLILVNTVSKNREGFTRFKYASKKAACRALGILGLPLYRDFKNMVCSNLIRNYTNHHRRYHQF